MSEHRVKLQDCFKAAVTNLLQPIVYCSYAV